VVYHFSPLNEIIFPFVIFFIDESAGYTQQGYLDSLHNQLNQAKKKIPQGLLLKCLWRIIMGSFNPTVFFYHPNPRNFLKIEFYLW
jgi:hypothetical protein